jgi:hypothetical protein
MATVVASSKLAKTKSLPIVKVTRKSTFSLVFDYNMRDKNGRQINNILERKPGQYAQISIQDLVNKVNSGGNIDFMSALERYQKLALMFDPANFPVTKMVLLGDLASDEDIQRELDVPHATHIFTYFDEQRVQSIQAVKTPGKEEYTMVNGQHTATVVALIVASGLMKGWRAKDWKKFPVMVSYIETLDRSKARETFALLNGEMSKEITTFDHWKQHYLSVRLDGSKNPKYLHTAKLIEILKSYECIPLPEDHDDAGMPGAVTHLNAVETAAKNGDYEKLEFIFSNRNKFWNNLPVDNTEFGFYGTLLDLTEEESILRNTQAFEEFLEDLHAVVQKVFSGMPKLKGSVTKAYKKYRYDQFVDKNASVPFNVALYVAYKVYKMLGGTFDIAPLNTMYVHNKVDVINYLTADELAFINKLVPAKAKIKTKNVVIPKATRKAKKV